MSSESFRVGAYRVRPDVLEIEGPQGVVRLEAKPVAVLQELARRAGKTCTREELLSAVWGDKFVGEEVLTHCIWEIRRALGDRPKDPTYIRTIPRRGYRLIAPVRWGPETAEIEVEPAAPERRGRSRWLVLVALGVAAVVAALLVSRFDDRSERRVVVPPTEIGSHPAGADDGAIELAAVGIRAALLAGLSGVEAVTVVAPEALGDVPLQDAVRALPIEEILSSRITASGASALVELMRTRASDGTVLWIGSFQAPLRPEDAALVAGAIGVQLRRAYADSTWRSGTAKLDVADDDYARFLQIRRRIDAGRSVDRSAELAEAEAVVAGSPRFLDGQLLVAELARSLYTGTHDSRVLARGANALEVARGLAPGDPRVALASLRLGLEAGRRDEAREALSELERLAPGELQIPLLKARLAQQEGRLDEAIAVLGEAIERFPSWQNLYRLADLEVQAGRIDAARAHLEQLLERSPGSTWGQARLADLELMYGDLDRAEEIYERLTAGDSPMSADLVNLGVARFLAGRYSEAAAADRAALRVAPGLAVALLNLADAERALGRTEAADAACEELLERTADEGSTTDALFRAQCLANLGRAHEAVALAQRVLADNPDDAEAVYQVAIVYAAAGERASAEVNVRRARELGVQERWFDIPALRGLGGAADTPRGAD